MFLVLGLPRSRTFWLSKFLSCGDYECGHEESRYLRSVSEAQTWLKQEYRGSAETAIAPFWRIIHKTNPDIRIVIVRRPIEDVIKSLLALDMRGVFEFDETKLRATITKLDAKLTQIEKRLPNVLSVRFDRLDDEQTIRAVFSHCLPYAFSKAWWYKFLGINLQCNMRALYRYFIAYRVDVDRMVKTAINLSRCQLIRKLPLSAEGVTFQQESLEDWARDGATLFEQHCIEIGEAPDNWKNKNFPLMQLMADAGNLHITTARANGRMFGYLAAVLSPSLEAREMLSGMHSTFYVSKDAPGIGAKLQRASIALLKEKGAREVLFYAGVRGSGPRLGSLYRRLGAKEFGALYRMEFENREVA